MKRSVLLAVICLYLSCARSWQGTAEEAANGEIDYCEELLRVAEYKYPADDTPSDSLRGYAVAMANCLMQMILEHNHDSLTTDSCLCRRRLTRILTIGYDSADLSFVHGTHNTIVTVRPSNPNVLDGRQQYEIDDSCRLTDFHNRGKR